MKKKLVCLLIVFALMVVSSVTAFANPPVGSNEAAAGNIAEEGVAEEGESVLSPAEALLLNIIADKDIAETEQFLVIITRPSGNEVVYKRNYVISGNTEVEGIEIVLAMYNEEKGIYEEYANTDGFSRWEAGNMFNKEIVLKEGINKLKIIAYKKSEENLEPGVNLQLNYFTIDVKNENQKNLITTIYMKAIELLDSVFNPSK